MTPCLHCPCHTVTATGETAADVYDLTVYDDGCAVQEIRVIEIRDERKSDEQQTPTEATPRRSSQEAREEICYQKNH